MKTRTLARAMSACALLLAITDPIWAQGVSPLTAASPAQASTGQAPQQPAPGQEMTMGCGMMGRDMRMGGMNMSGPSSTSMAGMGMNMGQNAITDMAQNVSMRDILQVVLDLARVQERMLEAMPGGKQAPGLRRDLERIKDTTGQLMGEIKGMINAAVRGQ